MFSRVCQRVVVTTAATYRIVRSSEDVSAAVETVRGAEAAVGVNQNWRFFRPDSFTLRHLLVGIHIQ